MLIRGKRRVWLLAVLLSLSQLGVACVHPARPSYQIGFVRMDGQTAVYTPICAGDTIAAIQVHQMPDIGESGDSTLLWDAEQPGAASTREGLIVLGAGFATVRQAPPAQFAGVLSVAVDTTAGRRYSAALLVPERMAEYPAGTPLADMSFVVEDGTVDHAAMRAHFAAEFKRCG